MATERKTPAKKALSPEQQRVAQAKAKAEAAKAEVRSAESVASRKNASPRKKARSDAQWKPGQSGNPAGRGEGVKNKLTEHKLRLMATTGMTPLEFLTAVYRDQLWDDYDVRVIDEKRMLVELLPKRDEEGELVARKVPLKIEHRIAAATSAAPYVHRKMPIGIDGGEGKPIAIVTAEKLAAMSDEELETMFKLLERLGLSAAFEDGAQKPYRLDGDYPGDKQGE